MIDPNLLAILQQSLSNALVEELYVHVANIRRLDDASEQSPTTEGYVVKRIPRSKVAQGRASALDLRRTARGHSALAFVLWVFRWSTIPLPHFVAFAVCVAATLYIPAKQAFSSEYTGQNPWFVVALIASSAFLATGLTSVWVQHKLKRW